MGNPQGSTMKAIGITGGSGPAAGLIPVEIPIPQPGEGQILVKVRAAGINRPDILQRMGLYPPPVGASGTLGLEIAGEVMNDVGRWKAGDAVCALLGGGGYAEYALCDARHALPLPPGLSFAEGASLPETVFTAYANLFELGRLKAGETVLIHGATSGIGVTAIQLAKAAGAQVIATARGAAKAAEALRLGADIAVDTVAKDFAEVAQKAGGVDVILDMVGGDYFRKGLDALNMGGRIVNIAFQAGNEVVLPIYTVMQKQATITGSTLRARNADEKARLAGEIERVVWPWIASGAFRPKIDRSFPLKEAATAHALLESGVVVGKLVLLTDPDSPIARAPDRHDLVPLIASRAKSDQFGRACSSLSGHGRP